MSNATRYRRRDTSPAWLKFERELLADDPVCARCDWPASEAHRVRGCFVVAEANSDYGAVEVLCARCHEDICTRAPRVNNSTYRLIEWGL